MDEDIVRTNFCRKDNNFPITDSELHELCGYVRVVACYWSLLCVIILYLVIDTAE